MCEILKVPGELFLRFQRGNRMNEEMLIGEENWNLCEAANKALFDNKVILLLDSDGKPAATMRNHPIDGYVINRLASAVKTEAPKAAGPATLTVSTDALIHVLNAAMGPPHHTSELIVTMMGDGEGAEHSDNPYDILLREARAQLAEFKAHAARGM